MNTGGRKDRRPSTRGKRVEKPEYRWRRTALLEPDRLIVIERVIEEKAGGGRILITKSVPMH